MLELHLRQVHLQFLGYQHRDGSIGALPHFDIGHGQNDLTVRINANKGIWSEISASRACLGGCEWQVQSKQQTTAGSCTSLQEMAAGDPVL